VSKYKSKTLKAYFFFTDLPQCAALFKMGGGLRYEIGAKSYVKKQLSTHLVLSHKVGGCIL